mmetsp:Transcript_10111/g.24890  ORF Transcript_10111/g.24890 Transcript_10111/m.24890 type:complete len:369 (-) Transcript_10111:240-1346(-)
MRAEAAGRSPSLDGCGRGQQTAIPTTGGSRGAAKAQPMAGTPLLEHKDERKEVSASNGNSLNGDGESKLNLRSPSNNYYYSNQYFRLVSLEELPKWRQSHCNPYILNGYRENCENYKSCLVSICYIHNESLNIWSHGIGLLAFLVFIGYTYGHTIWDSEGEKRGSYIDALIFAPFLLGATTCLLLSTLYHTFEPCSQKISLGWAKADYIGVTFLIWGSYFPVVHYLFYCQWFWQVLYLGIITVLSIATGVISVLDSFATGGLHFFRAILFSSLGVSGLAPIIHFAATNKIVGEDATKISYLLAMGVFYLTGAMFYAMRIPERWFPGSCTTDILLSSHFIFHMLVLSGAVCHWLGSVYDFHHTSLKECS